MGPKYIDLVRNIAIYSRDWTFATNYQEFQIIAFELASLDYINNSIHTLSQVDS